MNGAKSAENVATQLANLVENTLNEIFIFDQGSLAFLMVNKAARENLGYSMDELLVMTPVTIKPDFEEAGFRELLIPLVNGNLNKLVFETRHCRKDGTIYPVEVHLQLGEYGDAQVYSAIILDITERKKAEETRQQFDIQMLEAQKLESLGLLAGGIAHDFNNILTSIMGYADLAKSAAPPESNIHRYLTELLVGSKRGADLIKQMLAYSGKGKFIVEPIYLPELVEEIKHLLEVSISKKCTLHFQFDKDIPKIEADSTQIRQVVLNLLMNASESITENSGLISVRVGSFYADQKYLDETFLNDTIAAQEYVFLEVSDNGVGMDKSTVAKIFDPFFTTKFTGRGLGLAAVMGIVRGHKGALKVYTELGTGTTFKLLFPATFKDAPVRDSAQGEVPHWKGKGLVLVIDDEEQVRKLATEMLLSLGFDVITAVDGVEGLEKFQNRQEELVLVLLDLTMPRLNGASAYKKMREINSAMPTILSSGYNEQATINQFAGKGLAGFLQKPYTFEQMATMVQKALNQSGA